MNKKMDNKKKNINNKHFNSYFTGLIEGDGYILCPSDSNSVTKPMIAIAGHKKDKPFFEWFSNTLGYGTIRRGSSPNSIVWEVGESKNIKDICERTQHYFRTGKIDRMNNVRNYYSFKPIKLDLSHILSNGWLAGMSDADSNFNVIIGDRKKAGKTMKVKKINSQWRLEISTTTSNGISNLEISSLISEGLNTQVLMRTKQQKSKREKHHSIMIICFNEEQKNLLTNYFSKFPLLTAKRNDFENWKLIRNINSLKLNTTSTEKKIELVEEALKLKNQMNDKNIHVNWKHLNNVEFID